MEGISNNEQEAVTTAVAEDENFTTGPEELSVQVSEEPGIGGDDDQFYDCDIEPAEEGYERHLYEEREPETVMKWVGDMIYDTPRLDWSKVLWHQGAWYLLIHGVALAGLIDFLLLRLMWQSVVFFFVCAVLTGLGVTVGCHRLWSHRSFKVCLVARWTLMYMFSMAYQGSIHSWAENHRVHHKWSDQNADFTNANRGFFFAHMGCYMYETHPDVIEARGKVDCSDLMKLSEVRFQRKFYYVVAICACFVFPILFQWLYLNEDPWYSIRNCFLRLVLTHHVTFAINSVAHLRGSKPYDKNIKPCDNSVLGPLALGEGYHNYHHAFPRDYRAGEVEGWFWNLSRSVIEGLLFLGLASNPTYVSKKLVDQRSANKGDPSLRPTNRKTEIMVYVTPRNTRRSSFFPRWLRRLTLQFPVQRPTESHQKENIVNGNGGSEGTEKKND